MEVVLRTYQADSIQKARDAFARGMRRILLQAETGSGKTEMAVHMTQKALDKGSRVMFIASGRRLVGQAAERFTAYGINCGILMAGEDYTPAAVQVASKETLISWIKRHKFDLNEPNIVFVDECHEAMTAGWMKLLTLWQTTVVIGLTATPARSDGRGLGDYFQTMICTVPPSQLIAEKWLVPCRVFSPFRPDLKGVKLTAGDYNKKQLAARMDKPVIVGNVVQHWKDHAQGRPTLVFAVNIAHSMHLVEQFLADDVSAKHMDANTSDDDRKTIYRQLRDGEISVICSVGVNTRGVDLPFASCLVIVRPTKSFVLFRQMLGRGKRPADGKRDCLVFDHAGAVYRHGMPDEDIDWTLDSSQKIQDKNAKANKGGESNVLTCPKCHCQFSKSLVCPECGFTFKKKPRDVQTSGGKLVELTDHPRSPEQEREDLTRYWHYCLRVCAFRGRGANVAAAMFSQHAGKPPWKIPGLPNLPGMGQWKIAVAELFPQYLRAQRKPQEAFA